MKIKEYKYQKLIRQYLNICIVFWIYGICKIYSIFVFHCIMHCKSCSGNIFVENT